MQRFKVAKKYKRVVNSLRYKRSPYTAACFLKATPLKEAVIDQVATTIRRECAQVCSRNRGDSCLRVLSGTAQELKDFRWRMLRRELKKKAPTLLRLLEVAASGRTQFDPTIVGMVAALLLRGRNSQLCLLQSIVSVILYAGHTGKQVNILFETLL